MSIDTTFNPGTALPPATGVPVPTPSLPPADEVAQSAPDTGVSLFDGEGFSFSDILDLINPLQHIPVISAIYRDLTGDEIGAGARVLGSAVFGGIPGIVSSLINVFIEDQTGKDLGEHALALLESPGTSGETARADASAIRIAYAGKGTLAWQRALETASPGTAPDPAPAPLEDGLFRVAAGKAGGRNDAHARALAGTDTRLAAPANHSAPVMADIARDAYEASQAIHLRQSARISRLA